MDVLAVQHGRDRRVRRPHAQVAVGTPPAAGVGVVIVRGACRPGDPPPGQDRWAATDRSAIVLDGASAFDRAAPPADTYVDALLAALVERIDTITEPIPSVLADAIARAAHDVHAEPGQGLSSAVAVVRDDGEWIEAAVLGDSTIVVGLADGRTERLTDDRMGRVAVAQRERYRDRLRAGGGYDEQHRATLGTIQAEERAARNRHAGYWIAEADPQAADPAGAIFPRAKRHDDKTVVTWTAD
jgi:hypothetical protein